MNTATTYTRVHVPTTWLVWLITVLATITIAFAVIDWERSAPAAPSVPGAVPAHIAPGPIPTPA